jgi:hypothetical protein
MGAVDDVVAWFSAGYTTDIMFEAAQTILNAAATEFPSQSLKLPIHEEGVCLDGTFNPITGTVTAAATDVALATRVLSWAYGAFDTEASPERFFAQLNFVNATISPPDCVSPCALDPVNLQTGMTVNPQSPYSVFNLIRQYQPQGVGLQDVAGAVDGPAPAGGSPDGGCMQYGTACTFPSLMSCNSNGTTPCTPCTMTTNPDVQYTVQYAYVSQTTWSRVVQTYTPTFWEIGFDDATTTTGSANPCPITSAGQAAMQKVFADATSQLVISPTCAQNVDSEFYMTRSGYVFNFGTQRFYQTVKLTNIGSAGIGGPIELVLDNLNNASLSNKFGVTTCAAPVGSPYIAAVAATATLAPGASVSVVLQFSDPTKAPTTYTPRMLAGAGTP